MRYSLILKLKREQLLTQKETDDLIEDLEVTLRDDYEIDLIFSDLKLI